MLLQELGQKIQQKFSQYAGFDPVDIASKVINKLPVYAQHVSDDFNAMQNMDKQYGPGTSLGYAMSGGSGNIAQQAHDFLQKNNLPGQVMTGVLAGQRSQDPQFQTNQQLANQNYSISPQQVAQTKQAGFIGVGGLLGPVEDIPEELQPLAQETPQTARVWINSKFSNGGSYADIPITRKVDNMTLYQGGLLGDNRQFWTPDKEYAEQFGNVTKKTGSFFKVDNGNRVTDVYVEAQKNK